MANNLLDLMHHAMENISASDERERLRSDADFHKTALLEVISLIGEVLEKSQLQQYPAIYNSQNICSLGNFLQSAPELIRSMDALIEGYEDMAANNQGVNHV